MRNPANTRLTASLGDLYIRSGKPAEALDLVNKDKPSDSNIDMLQPEGRSADRTRPKGPGPRHLRARS